MFYISLHLHQIVTLRQNTKYTVLLIADMDFISLNFLAYLYFSMWKLRLIDDLLKHECMFSVLLILKGELSSTAFHSPLHFDMSKKVIIVCAPKYQLNSFNINSYHSVWRIEQEMRWYMQLTGQQWLSSTLYLTIRAFQSAFYVFCMSLESLFIWNFYSPCRNGRL